MNSVTVRAGDKKSSALERSLLEISRRRQRNWPDWLLDRKRHGCEWLEQNGLVKARDEAWRNTPISAILDQGVVASSSNGVTKAIAERSNYLLPSSGPILWMVNGVAMTDAAPIPGVRWLSLAEAARRESRVQAHLGSLAAVENGFVASNLASFEDGWCIVIDDGATVDGPIEVRFIESAERASTVSFPRLLVLAGSASRASLIERHVSVASELALSSCVVEIVLAEGARLEHSRYVEHGAKTWAVVTTAASVGSNAEYRAWSAVARGRFVRNDVSIHLAGRRSTADLDGIYYARRDSLVAQYVRVWHEQPEGVTRESFRGVIENDGRGVFDGIVYVGANAKRTDARQENRNLLLGPNAIANTKPHLEIDNDDVTCSHGATVGQLDEQQLFYLRARGIAEEEARAVLTWAFAKEIVDRCPSQEIRVAAEKELQASAEVGVGSQLERAQ